MWVNILLVFFIIALAALSLWWAFNTLRQIQLQKEFATFPLISIAKLWKKAKFIPEDAKDRESLYLYKDFLAKFEEGEGKYPIMVKNGGVRCMSRAEYDRLCQQKDKKPVSILVTILTVLYAVCAIAFNAGSNLVFGICMALIMPVLQIILALFIHKFNRDKNNYRNQLFLELKENSVDFLRVTKPFIIVDAYPQKFGKKEPAKFVGTGELPAEQIEATKAFIIRQKEAETKVVMQTVDNHAEIDAIKNPQPVEEVSVAPSAAETNPPVDQAPAPVPANDPTPATTTPAATTPESTPSTPETTAPTADAAETTQNTTQTATDKKPHALDKVFGWVKQKFAAPTKETAQPATATPAPAPTDASAPADSVLSREDKETLLMKLVYEHLVANDPTAAEPQPAAETPAVPDEDDFSLDSIGIALDAELAKRRKIS